VSSYKPLIIPGIGLLVLGAYWVWRSGGPPAAATAVDGSAKAPPAAKAPRTSDPGADGKSASVKPGDTGDAGRGGEPPTTEAKPERTTRRDRKTTDAIREQLRAAARSRRSAGNGGEAAPAASTLDAAYIQARVREDLLPIAQECYETALETQPKLAGKLVMRFSIVGDPEVGGVVDEAAEDPSSEIKDPDLLECMRESMLSLSFVPPEDGGTVEVTYPFVFASDDAPAGKPSP
jgi:hypothetical protein